VKTKIYKRFKESNGITLYNGNCLNIIKKLPDESVDLVMTSPPYCMGKAYEELHDDINTFRNNIIAFLTIYTALLNQEEAFAGK
jgi:adenine-specific DNA-methyltransferase